MDFADDFSHFFCKQGEGVREVGTFFNLAGIRHFSVPFYSLRPTRGDRYTSVLSVFDPDLCCFAVYSGWVWGNEARIILAW